MNPKLKNENYQEIGGINSKFSPYVTTNLEFLDIKNYDYQTPGALSQRWGSTQYISQNFSGAISSLYEFARLDGSSVLIVGVTGAIWSGATQTNLTGLSFTTLGVTTGAASGSNGSGNLSFFVAGILNNHIGAGGPSFGVGLAQAGIQTSSGQNIYGGFLAEVTQFFMDPAKLADNTLSIKTFNNFAFMADGNKFVKYDGVTTTPVSLPYVSVANEINNIASGPTVFASTVGSTVVGLPAIGMSGVFYVYLSYVNSRGFEGPLTPVAAVESNFDTYNATFYAGGTWISFGLPVVTWPAYGISAINQYVYFAGPSIINCNPTFIKGAWQTQAYAGTTNTPFNYLPIFVSQTPASGSTLTWIYCGSTSGLYNTTSASVLTSNIGTFYQQNNYLPIGGTFQVAQNDPTGTYIEYDVTNYYPRYLEIFANRLFLAGFSLTPSLVWFSDSAEPEGYQPDWNFEVRTNDGDYITCIKSYLTRLYIFKKNSFHVLTGDNQNNFDLQEISDIYGCVNNRCAVVYRQTLLFLDRKGIIAFNGSSLDDLFSTKIQSYFDRMNYTAALTTAVMTYDKLRNQIMCAIPIDGSTTNNLTIVYDTISKSWTTYSGILPSVFANIQGTNNTRYPFFGDYSGRVAQSHPSLMTDFGVGMTLYFKTHFHHEMGQTVTKQARRLYINKNTGETLTPLFNFYQDYGSSIISGPTFILSQFQERLDFGIACKAIAFEMYAAPQVTPLTIYGYSFEERMQRMV